jgi:transcriptional regulatory protein LevR
MSEKQSTDELVRALEIQLKMETDCVITNLEIRAIIARLRATDNLKNKSLMKLASDLGVSFSAAKIISDHVRAECDAKLRAADALCKAAGLAVFEIPAPTPDSLMTFKIDGSMDDLRKAIAEYERKA